MRKQELHPRTAMINKKQKLQAKQARNEALLWLAALFPRAFDNSVLIRPLKLGIMTDILAHEDAAAAAGISKSKLREAVVMYTRRIDYLTCLKAREVRVDLEGNPGDTVTEEEATRAAMKIKKRIEKSVKNVRKTAAVTSQAVVNPREATHKSVPFELETNPYQPDCTPVFNTQSRAIQAPRASAVTITHKSARTYDPDMVARLKEKLGLSRKTDVDKETT